MRPGLDTTSVDTLLTVSFPPSLPPVGGEAIVLAIVAIAFVVVVWVYDARYGI